jgi:competence protein ComEA
VWKQDLPRSQWLAITLVAGVIFLVLLLRLERHRRPLPPPGPLPVVVEVQGDVQSAGVYLLHSPATVAEAVVVAGGCRSGYRVAATEPMSVLQLNNGERLHVSCPAQGPLEVRREAMDAAARLTLGAKLDLNEASAEELCLVPGMQTHVAETIVARRRDRKWRALNELGEISGVGPKTLQRWGSYLEVRSPSPRMRPD